MYLSARLQVGSNRFEGQVDSFHSPLQYHSEIFEMSKDKVCSWGMSDLSTLRESHVWDMHTAGYNVCSKFPLGDNEH